MIVGSGTPSGGGSGTDSSAVVRLGHEESRAGALRDDVDAREGGVAVHVVPVVMRVHDDDAALAGALARRNPSTGAMSCGRISVSTTKARPGVSATAVIVGKPSASMRWTQTSCGQLLHVLLLLVRAGRGPPLRLFPAAAGPAAPSADHADVLGGVREQLQPRRR